MSKLSVFNAYTREVINEIPTDNETVLENKLSLAFKTFKHRDQWLKPYEKIKILNHVAQLLSKHKDEFSQLIALEGGKPLRDAIIEVSRAIDGLSDASNQLRNLAGEEIPMGLTSQSDHRLAFTTYEPIGVVAAISAFNHPLNLIVHQIAPAIAVGCPVIVKPASTTPLCCLELVKLFYQAGLAEKFCQTLITDDVKLSERFATDQRVSFLSFIGSEKVGWYLRSKLAPGTHCTLEHGGVAPVIVESSANLHRGCELITKGGYYHAGQVCVSVQRVFVHKKILKEFLNDYVARVTQLSVGDPLLSETEVGPLITPKETIRVEGWIDEAVKAGAKIFGGGRLSETTLKPSILINPPLDAKVSTSEIFGPTTCVYEYEDLNKAIEIANSLPYSFQSSIFTQDITTALQAARKLEAATVLINDHSAFRTDWMPFAGYKQSGYGVGGIRSTMQEMSMQKLIVFNYG